MPPETIESFNKEWRELILSKLVKMDADLAHLNNQVTDMRVTQVSAKQVEKLELEIQHQDDIIENQNKRIGILEQAKTQIWTIFVTIQLIIGAAWSILLFLKK